jgi:probable rRNA maturation factor
VAVTADGLRLPLGRASIAELVRFVLRRERVKDALISLSFVTSRASARLNREHLQHAGPTDVITFALAASGPVTAVGDVYICPDVVREQAKRFGVPVRAEFQRVIVHATLHVLGYEHPNDAGRETSAMWRRQERLLAAFLRQQA